ncbi:hypothetical protein Rleg2_1133 [Rhizobium leguminosarum bv. trifolii WSM2304]|uniref:Uncharacterized protein n=1 Tax=Rhizobium leguminosarum bv. trifolii (strain WSM2304) TaxID=395492 RepID=A0ABF7QKG4_RHILW|nr:hypothetical protein [Rhizobium leguminosarum]ACI54427.1 hypothetical protein Rleg2_1133 [Rhizobium leguminosarum bv. trifolii WSM2304]
MNTLEPFAQIAERAKRNAARREQDRRLNDLVQLIDDLSAEMGSYDFVTALRAKGYNIEADGMALSRRGITTH